MREITDIKEIQSIALGVLKYIDKICKENSIPYSLAGGTALGAIRHKGFIPWDDDIDIIMTRPNYEKFLKIMDNTKSDKYKCLHYGKDFPNYFYRFAKVCDLSTSLKEGEYIQNPDLGVFVDVFPSDGVDEKNIEKIYKKLSYYSSMIGVASLKKYTKSKKGVFRSVLKFFAFFYAKIFGWEYWLKKYEKLLSKYKFEDYEKTLVYCGGYGTKEIFDKSIYDELIEVEFEKCKFPVVKNYDLYLKSLYGNYMQLPPKEKQITHHEFKIYKK